MLFILIFLITLIVQFFSLWWSLALIAFIAAYLLGKSGRHAFFSGFFAIALLWIILALFQTLPNDNILAARMARVFTLPHWSLVLVVTVLIGALVGGLSAWSGYLMRRAVTKK
ncbi:MAG: hypothetical protein INR69_01790 [Mucilaginibacter polytrichastri]|nr:hypothetical protein [Mucilaginibacter polytrichastri]